MNTQVSWGEIPGWLQIVVIVFVAVQLCVELYALVVMLRTPDERLVLGKKWPWILIIVFVNFIGAIVFLAAGRKPAPAVDPLIEARSAAAPPAGRAERAADVLYGSKEVDEA